MNAVYKSMVLAGLVALLLACGGGSDNGTGGYVGTGDLNLSITDAPVDGASAVWVTISGMKLKRTENSAEKHVQLNGSDVTNNQIRVNLLDLANGESAALFADSVTSGDYQWIRFELEDACIVFEDAPGDCVALQLPTKDELKTSGSFKVPGNGVANIMVDWDLRKSIVKTGSAKYKLKPVLHLRESSAVGSISGVVSLTDSTTCAIDDVRAIYVFAGNNIIPDDIDGTGVEPLATVYVYNDDSFYIGMLDAGTYTLAFTCNAARDELETDETTNNPATGVNFPETAEVTVVAGQQTSNIFLPAIN